MRVEAPNNGLDPGTAGVMERGLRLRVTILVENDSLEGREDLRAEFGLSLLVEPEVGARRIGNLYESFSWQLRDILRRLGLASIRELRGRTDLLVYR